MQKLWKWILGGGFASAILASLVDTVKDLFIHSLPSIMDSLVSFFSGLYSIFLLDWRPGDGASEFIKLLYVVVAFSFLFCFLVGLSWAVQTLIRNWVQDKLAKTTVQAYVHILEDDDSVSDEDLQEYVSEELNYANEVATVLEKIENPAITWKQASDAVENFLINLADNVALSFGLEKNEYRSMWIVPDEDQRGWRGVRFQDFGLTPLDEHFAHAILMDPTANANRVVAEMRNFPNYDAPAIAMIRNKGTLKLGLVIVILKEGVVTPQTKQSFNEVSSVLLFLGHFDQITKFVLEWK